MLPRTHRLRHRSDYQGLYRAGRGWSHSLLTLQLAPQETGQRVGVVVSKKVGGAVVRNRVRRRIREAVR
ncbi:MAG: ribonuclease P protein component, partial [Armatimonadetes bacterium]|nr:ribonuclease P protein component [Armatimonadota bacterium]